MRAIPPWLARNRRPPLLDDSPMCSSVLVPLRRALLLSGLLLGAPEAVATSSYERAVELTTAVSSGDARHMEHLLDSGHEVNARTRDNSTTLHAAAEYGRLDMVRSLLEKGADPWLEDDAGLTARDVALVWGHRDVAALLEVAERSQSRPFILASTRGAPRLQRARATGPSDAAPLRESSAKATPTGPGRSGNVAQRAPGEFKSTGITPRGGTWTGDFASGTGRVRFTVDSSGRTLTGVELEGDIRCTRGGTGRAPVRGEWVDSRTREATFVIERGAFNGTFRDPKAGVQWHVQGHFLASGNAVGRVRIAARSGTCDTWGLEWTASP
ncbi:ankyrin repeat domain-containing protein [Pyxidicoccus sp. 3LG]